MNKSIIIITLIIALVSLYFSTSSQPLGNIATNPDAYNSAGVAYSSSTLSSGAEEVLSRATSSRSFARICNRTGEDVVYLYKKSTSTGVVVNGGGFPLNATSSCMTINQNDPYTGAVWAVSSASTTVGIEAIQE